MHTMLRLAAVENAGLTAEQIGGNPRYGIAGGSGGGSTALLVEMKELLRHQRCT